MADTSTDETVTPEVLKNDATTTTAPPVVSSTTTDNSSDQAAAELQKQLKQAEMERNLLRNKLDEKNKAEEAAKQAELEKKEEFRSLYEQEKAKREQFEKELQDGLQKQTIEKEQNALFSEFPEAVVETAKGLGLELREATEDAKAELKTKLETLNQKVAPSATKVTPNNPNPNNNVATNAELLSRIQRGDKKALDEAVLGLSVIEQMKQSAGIQAS